MDERAALRLLADDLPHAGDDAAIVGSTAITTDMLHETTDFPPGTTRYTAGWRSVGASLSDVAAMGASPTAAVAAYADDSFDPDALGEFVTGARDVCEAVGAAYVGGDLDHHTEFTVATTAIGDVEAPVYRSGATPGDAVVVTGTFGRSAAALRYFEASDFEATDFEAADAEREASDANRTDADRVDADEADALNRADALDRANDLFQFEPRVEAGLALEPAATAMMDSSDGLARSLHQLAEASDCGFEIEREAVPIDGVVEAVAAGEADRWEMGVHFGEDFELVATVPVAALEDVKTASPTPLSIIGRVVEAEAGVTVDGEPLADRGYTHS